MNLYRFKTQQTSFVDVTFIQVTHYLGMIRILLKHLFVDLFSFVPTSNTLQITSIPIQPIVLQTVALLLCLNCLNC